MAAMVLQIMLTKLRIFEMVAIAVICSVIGMVNCGTAVAAAPSINASPASVKPGDNVVANVRGLQSGSAYLVEICGQEATSSLDCLNQSSASSVASSLGEIEAYLSVEVPPTPCPCVIAVFSQPYLQLLRTTPLRIEGAPYGQVVRAKAHLVVRGSELKGSTSLAEQLGASGNRTLLLTLANTGDASVARLTVLVSVDGTPQGEHVLAGLRPSAQRTYQLRVALPTLAIGDQKVSGEITAQSDTTATFTTSTTVFPWGLLLIGLLVIQMILLALRNIARRRRERNSRPSGQPTAQPFLEKPVTDPIGVRVTTGPPSD